MPFDGTQIEVPWYLDMLDSSSEPSNHSDQFITSPIESVITSSLQVRDIELALRRQLSKLKESDTNERYGEAVEINS